MFRQRSVIFMLLVSGSMLSACHRTSDSDEQTSADNVSASQQTQYQRPVAYQVGSVIFQKIQTMIPIGGHIIPRNQVTLSARAPGRVVFVAGKEGTKLKEGQVVFRLDDEGLLAKRKAAWAQLNHSMSELQNANVQLSRQIYGNQVQPQGGMGMPSMFDYFMTRPMNNMMGTSNTGLERAADITQSRTGVDGAQAAVLQAQSRLDEMDAALKDKTSKAPGKSVILEKFVEEGDSVQPGQPLAKIADTDNLQVKLDLPTRLLKNLHEGMMIPIQTEMGERIQAVLEQIFPTADPSRHTVTIKLALPPHSKAAPGMYVQAMIPDSSADTPALPIIPSSAVVWRGGQPSVFVIGKDNKTQMRMVRVGEDLGGRVAVLSGLKQNEHFLISPPPAMRSGQEIYPPTQRGMSPIGSPSGYAPMQMQPYQNTPNQMPYRGPMARPYAYKSAAGM
ncbi:MAG: efflux RND transporter periplasmic adaptor subunit [bacterium]